MLIRIIIHIIIYCFIIDIKASDVNDNISEETINKKSTYSILNTQNNLPLPRFVSIKSNEVNARLGPTTDSIIEWVFIKKGEPVEVIAQYGQWRKIRDIKGEGGWVHSSVLSKKRSCIVISDEVAYLYNFANTISSVIAHVHNNTRCSLLKCKEELCYVSCKKTKGWIQRKDIWGVYKNEKF